MSKDKKETGQEPQRIVAVIEQTKNKFPYLLNIHKNKILLPNLRGEDGFLVELPTGKEDAVIRLEDYGFRPEDINSSTALARAIKNGMLRVLTEKEAERIESGNLNIKRLGATVKGKSMVETLEPEVPHEMPMNHFDNELVKMEEQEERQNAKAALRARPTRGARVSS